MERFKEISITLYMTVMMALFVPLSYAQEVSPKTYNLTLEEVSSLALNNNVDIQLLKYDALIAKTNKDVAESIYATVFNAEASYQKDKSAQPTTFFGSKTVDTDYAIGFNKKLPSGTDFALELKNNREKTNSAFSSSPVTHNSILGLTVKQDLGKNFFGIEDRGNVKVTLIDVENSQYTSREQIESSLANVQKSYWAVVLAKNRIKIQEQMVEQAKKLFDLQEQKLLDGLAEKPDVLASEANYKKQINTLKLLRNSAKRTVNQLALELNVSEKVFDIVPQDGFAFGDEEWINDQVLKAAFNHRQDYKKARNEIKSKNIILMMKKVNLWPEINLTASLEQNGLGGDFSSAVQEITEEDSPKYFAGVSVSIPLLNKEARAQLKAAEFEKAKALLNLKYIERKIFIEITNALRDVKVLHEVAVNSQEVSILQEEKLAAEEKRFNRGRSGTDTIIRFQEDVFRAKEVALQALFEYKVAYIDLERHSGVLLNKYWDDSL